MIRNTEELLAALRAARRASTPLVSIRTGDPASAIALTTRSLNGDAEGTSLLYSYNIRMEVGIRDARNNLSKLVEAVLDGEEVFLTNRGARVVQLVRTPKATPQGRGRGSWKGKIHPDAAWDSRDED
jgi:antitoxin (DNA-binding transcriptional repressor) of toxin-antitoxin stability system